MDLHTCRLCGEWETDLQTGPMVKYSIRHYAHLRCGIERWGREWLDSQPAWVLKTFPFFLCRDLGILDYLRARVAQEEGKV
jgi:hypothetical protein